MASADGEAVVEMAAIKIQPNRPTSVFGMWLMPGEGLCHGGCMYARTALLVLFSNRTPCSVGSGRHFPSLSFSLVLSYPLNLSGTPIGTAAKETKAKRVWQLISLTAISNPSLRQCHRALRRPMTASLFGKPLSLLMATTWILMMHDVEDNSPLRLSPI